MNLSHVIATSEQACALGSAMAASVVAGVHKSLPEAQKAMGGGFETIYHPISENVETYKTLFNSYKKLGSFIEGKCC